MIALIPQKRMDKWTTIATASGNLKISKENYFG
jgi:hypothetical protein